MSVRRALPFRSTNPRSRAVRLGVALYVVLAVVLGLLAVKPKITSFLASGQTIKAEFANGYKLRANDSSVKFAGITVGNVTGIESTDRGTTLVTMKVDESTIDKLGSKPTARIEPRTLLGGRYAIELHRGGAPGAFNATTIPVSRTAFPVEFDAVLEALPASARESLQSLVRELEGTLRTGKAPLKQVLKDAPEILDPAGVVVKSASGTRPDRDLAELVSHLSTTAEVLTEEDGRLDAIVTSLHETSAVLAAQRQPLSQTLASLPATMRDARAGLSKLEGSFDRLTVTAKSLRPVAPELNGLVTGLDPLLKQLRPLMSDLRPALQDAQPAVRDLVPAAQRGTGVLSDLQGPVLDRVNGPVMDFLLNPWHGTGYYRDSGRGIQAGHKFYEELGYLATNIDRASMGQDQHGAALAFQVGAGSSTLSGLPFSIENLVKLALEQSGGSR